MSDVSHVTFRRAKPGCAEAYGNLVRGMLKASSLFPGYLSATVIPPEHDDGQFQIIQHFSSQEALDRWHASAECTEWHERLRPVVASEPEYRLLSGMEVWFSPKLTPINGQPPRWRMTIVSWMGIFPIVALVLWLVNPALLDMHMPFLPRVAILTILVVPSMSYLVMPILSRAMRWFLHA